MPGWMRPSAAPTGGEPRAGRPGWPWDFDDPTIPTTEQDAAATAIAAAALLKLARVGPEERRVRYREFAEVTIEAPPPGTSRWTASTPMPAYTSAPDGRPVHAVLSLDTDIIAYTIKSNEGRSGG